MSLVVSFGELFSREDGLLAKAAHWERIELKKVATLINGYPLNSTLFNKLKGFPIVRIRDLKFNKTQTLTTEKVSKQYLVDDGDFLIGMDGDFICYKWSGGQAVLNQRVCKLISNKMYLHPKFLFYAISGYLDAIHEVTSSVTVKHLSSIDILNIPFPIPPLTEQHRIVAKLDQLMEKIDRSRARLERVPQILERFRQSVLAAAVNGRLTEKFRRNEGVIERFQLGDLLEDLKYGTSQKSETKGKGTPILRIPNIGDGAIILEDLKYSNLPKKEYEKLKLIPGDVLIIRSNGSVSLVGKAAIVSEKEAGFAYAGYLIRLRCNPEKILPEFLNLALASYDLRLQIELPARSTSGVNNINSNEVRALEIPTPKIQEQQEIIRIVAQFFAVADKIESRYDKAKAQLDKLPQSLLAKAFRGELVEQDPKDEPANVLLKRITVGKTDDKAPKRGRRIKHEFELSEESSE